MISLLTCYGFVLYRNEQRRSRRGQNAQLVGELGTQSVSVLAGVMATWAAVLAGDQGKCSAGVVGVAGGASLSGPL